MWLGLFVWLLAPAFAADNGKRNFNVPAGAAGETLKEYAKQAGREIVFAPESVSRVATNPVQGTLTAREALDLMLSGTGLVGSEDPKTGAVAVRKGPTDPNGSRAAPIVARSVRPTTSDLAAADAVVELSPFVVNTDRDTGFVAASSLAGGRLATELKDTPAAYSVLTREFIDAMGITDLAEASDWTVGFANATDHGEELIYGNSYQFTVRGVRVARPQRNFFGQAVNFDSYNLDRYDFARGPNAILFGEGTFGGVPNVVTKVARADRSFTQVHFEVGSWNKKRATMDMNRPISKSAALRTNVLWEDGDGWRDFQNARKRAATLAGLWRLGKDTELRGEIEFGRSVRDEPMHTWRDSLLGWDGVTVNDRRVFVPTTATTAGGLALLGSATQPTPMFVPGSGIDGITNWAQTAETVGGSSTWAGGVSFNGSVVIGGNPLTELINLPPSMFDLPAARSNFVRPGKADATGTDTPTYQQKYLSHSLFFRHRFAENFYTEIAGNVSGDDVETSYMNSRGLLNLQIDVNRYLPNGQANPHFLDTYSQGQRTKRFADTRTSNVRAATAYIMDLDRWGKYTFSGYGGLSWSKEHSRITSLRVLRENDPRRWAFNDAVFFRYYTADTWRPTPEFTSATYTDPVTNVTTAYPVAWINDGSSATNVTKTDRELQYLQAALKSVYWKNRLHVLTAVRYDSVEIKRQVNRNYGDYPADWDGNTIYYKPAAPEDYLTLPAYTPKDANGRPTGTPAYPDRRPRDANNFRLPQYGNDRFQDDYSPPVNVTKSTTVSLGGVFHVTPWLSAFANYSKGFAPSSGNLFIDSTMLPPAKSHGSDLGLKMTLLNNRIYVALSRYDAFETPEESGVPGNRRAQINNLINTNARGDFSSDGTNRRGVANVATNISDIRDRSTVGYELDVTANLTRSWRLMLNGSLPKAYQENALSKTREWFTTNDEVLRGILSDAGVLVDDTGNAYLDPSITDPLQMSPDRTGGMNAWNALRGWLATLTTGKQKIQRLHEYTANVAMSYGFDQGVLKGFGATGGVKFRGKEVIGYRTSDTMLDPANPARVIDDPSADEYTPVYNRGYAEATAGISYRTKFTNGWVMKVNLRVDNMLDEDRPRYYSTSMRPPGGDTTTRVRVTTPVEYRLMTPRNFRLTFDLNF